MKEEEDEDLFYDIRSISSLEDDDELATLKKDNLKLWGDDQLLRG